MSNHEHEPRREVALCRSWLFVPGADAAALRKAPECGADALIQELEDFVPRERRAEARDLIAGTMAAWRDKGALAGVRINPFADGGHDDLDAAMAAGPDFIALPKVAAPEDAIDLDREVRARERHHGQTEGETALVLNIESARGLMRTFDILTAAPRVGACIVASEDMAADLGAERGRDGIELAYVRARFLVECRAAGVPAIDCPYTFADEEGAHADTLYARRLGYTAKSAVMPAHAAVVNAVLTPSADETRRARALVAAFEAARAAGHDRADLDGHLIEVPTYLTAKRLIARARAYGVGDGDR